jgi:hypothetical protein
MTFLISRSESPSHVKQPKSRSLLFAVIMTLSGCSEYGGIGELPSIPVAPDSDVSVGYLIDRTDWIISVRDELLVKNAKLPSRFERVRFNGRPDAVSTGSKVLAWRCGDRWEHEEIFVDSSRFNPPDFSVSCQA